MTELRGEMCSTRAFCRGSECLAYPGRRRSLIVSDLVALPLQIPALSPHLWFAAATHQSVALTRRIAARLNNGLYGADGLVRRPSGHHGVH